MSDWTHLQDIIGSDSDTLNDKLIGLGVSASVACLETHRLARQLMRHGARVQIFLTPAAREMVSPTALGWSTGRAVISELTAACEHLQYFGVNGTADMFLLAPCTANTLAKIAMGLDDNAVTTCVTTALGMGIPILCAPGMHEPMMNNPAVLSNLKRVKEYGVELLAPTLAEGKQKMMGVPEMVARVQRRLGPKNLRGKRVLITGGPTREFLDPARCLTNPSSGLTACLLAEEAYRRGGEVVLVYGPGKVKPSSWLEVDLVVSAEEMLLACERRLAEQTFDVCVACAAVSDFRPARYAEDKLPTADGGFSLELEVTPKILDTLRRRASGACMVAFKAASSRTDEELKRAVLPYLEDKRADLVVGNSVVDEGLGFDSDHNRYLVGAPGPSWHVLGPAGKSHLARRLWDRIVEFIDS